jgi:hypothetical protein
MHTKPCISCHNSLPLDGFYKHKQMRDGHLNKCKSCCKTQEHARRADNLQRIREYDRNRPNRLERTEAVKQYGKTAKGRAVQQRAKDEWSQRNMQKRKAQWDVNNAIRDGRLIKPTNCESCSGIGKIEGHHDDYSLSLLVRWLCDPCHKKHHKMLRNLSRKVAA